MANNNIVLLSFLTALFACSKGDLELYVRSADNDTACPATGNSTNCRIFSDYATDQNLTFDQNTSFVFLPGQHFLDTIANFSYLVRLSFRPFDVESNTSVIVDQGGSIVLQLIDFIDIAFLEIQSRSTSDDDKIPIVFQVVGADVKVNHCNFTNNAARAFMIMDSSITLVGNLVSHSKRSWLGLNNSNATLIDNVISHNNLANEPNRALIHIANGYLTTAGTNSFSHTGNDELLAGVVSGYNYVSELGGEVSFSKNSGKYAGVIIGFDCELVISGDATFSSNSGGLGGVTSGSGYRMIVTGSALFSGNSAFVAGVIEGSDCELLLGGNTFFLENSGNFSGVFFGSDSAVVVDGYTVFMGNSGERARGGVFSGTGFTLTVNGSTVFSQNSGTSAGVIHGVNFTVFIGGNSSFSDNFGGLAGVIYGAELKVVIDGNTDFSGNSAYSAAGVMGGTKCTMVVDGNTSFSGNSANIAGAIWALNCTMAFNGFTTFSGNSANSSGVFYGRNYTVTVEGITTCVGNSGGLAGVAYGANYTMVLGDNATFLNNNGVFGGVLGGTDLTAFVSGDITFQNNNGDFGGVSSCLNCHFFFTGGVTFLNNQANYGGTFYSVSSTIAFVNNSSVTFQQNSAVNGGALYLASSSTLVLYTNTTGPVKFVENTASKRGGAVFIQDANTFAYCLPNSQEEDNGIAAQDCAFQVSNYYFTETYDTRMYFINNYAPEAGSAIYGGAIDTCLVDFDESFIVYGQQLFNSIAMITSNTTGNGSALCSTISSDPFIVCTCDGNDPICTNTSIRYSVYPGASIELRVIALGQRNGTVPATIVSFPTNLTTQELQTTQAVPNECSYVSYTVYAEPGMASIEIYTEGTCLTQGVGLTVEIEVFNCPPGFVMADENLACVCHPSIVRYTNSCNPQDGTILRENDRDFWVGYNDKTGGIILYSSCPFDYCITETISFNVEDSDAQCNHDRSGLLCGECSEGLSLLLGSSSCEKCSDDYLALLLFFAAAGVILVAFLLLLNLTVAIGTINGLIFYANIVAANEALVFPSNSNTYLDILKVFIAWINLDFGIKSCLYDGMDQYAKTWLQYAFPLYIWVLIGLVFLVSRFSARVARIFGKNPVAVLATLILLSYTKILRTIIEAFSSATLEYSEGESRLVWLNDGNVPFLDTSDGRHLGLFLASLLVLLALFTPYTLILLTSQWLQIKSHWKVLSWLNKPQLRSFLDAYHAPYKPRHRYWTGLLLLVRFALLVTTARTLSTNPSVIFLVVQIFVLLLLVWVSFFGGVYRKWYLNVLEGFFFVNLGLLSASIHHIRYSSSTMELSSSETQTSSTAVTSTLVTAALAAFLGIVAFHIYLKVKETKGFKAITTYMTRTPEPEPVVELKEPVTSTDTGVSTNYTTLREPLLDDA